MVVTVSENAHSNPFAIEASFICRVEIELTIGFTPMKDEMVSNYANSENSASLDFGDEFCLSPFLHMVHPAK